jgi:hypothetical protein
VSRSPSPVPPPPKAPVKIIRPPKEPVASTPKTEQPPVKGTSQVNSQPKVKARKSAPQKPTPLDAIPNPQKHSAATQPLPLSPTVITPPPPAPFVPSDLYISMMSGLAMANMPQAMQAAATADPMVAFQLAQMCFARRSAFPLPPCPLIPPKPDPVAVQLPAPKLPPRPASNPIPKSNPKSTPAPALSPVLQQDNPKLTPTQASTVTIEMDPLVLKQKRQARKHNIGWIPVPGFLDRGTFNLVPTPSYLHWSSSGRVTQPDPQRSLVMEDLPLYCRTVEFVRSWSDKFAAIAVYLNGGGKALIEFPSRKVAEEAYDSPRLRDGPYEKATHVRVFWYRPQMGGAAPFSMPATSENAGAIGEAKDVLTATTSANITTAFEGPVSTTIDYRTLLAGTAETWGKAQSKGKSKGPSLPPPEHGVPDVDLLVRSSAASTSTPRRESLSVTILSTTVDQEQRRQSSPVDRDTGGPGEGPERTPSRSPILPSLSASSGSPTKVPSPHPRSPSPETTQRERTPTNSPPSLRYPSSTPEMTNYDGRVPTPSGETSAHVTPPPTSASEPSVAGDASLERQLRAKLMAMKRAGFPSRISEQSSSTSTPSTVFDPEPDTLFKMTSPPPVSQIPDGIVISESLELLATSFITDTLQAAQGLPTEPGRFDAAMKARLNKKRGSGDAFGSSADIAFKRQRLAQQIEESKRIMEQWKAAKTKEERNQIYSLWEESNRFVLSACVDCALILLRDPSFASVFRSVELLSKPAAAPFRWPCYAERCLIIDSDDEEEPMDLS